jgi:hypothetical protein
VFFILFVLAMLSLLAWLFWMILSDIQPPVVEPPVTTGSHRKVIRPSYQPYVARHVI